MTLTADNNPQIIIKNTSASSLKKIEFGEVGIASNGGRIWYSNNNMDFYANGIRSLKLNNQGFVRVGSDASAPEIKTWFNTVDMPNLVIQPGLLTLPADEENILSVKIMYTQSNGTVSEVSAWDITSASVLGIVNNASIAGRTLRVFVIYKN
jgi:hypothetical protein